MKGRNVLQNNGHDGYNGDTAKSMLMNVMEILDVGYLFSNHKPTLQIPLLGYNKMSRQVTMIKIDMTSFLK